MSRRRGVSHRPLPGKENTSPKASSSLNRPFDRWRRIWEWGIYPLLILVVLVFVTVRPINDPDCWFHMAHGRYFLEHGKVLDRDIFSHTASGREWISSGWFTSVVMQSIFQKWGPPGLTFLVTVTTACIYGLIYVLALKRKAGGELAAIVVLCSILAGYMRFNPRPDLLSLACLPLFLALLQGIDHWNIGKQSPPWYLWLLPLVIAVWANLHAGFLAGLIILWIAVAGVFVQMRQSADGNVPSKFLVIAGITSIAWIANPYGWRIVELAAKIRAIPGVRMLIFEWMPLVYLPGFNLPWPHYVGIAALAALWWLAWKKGASRQKVWHVGGVLFLALFAFWQRRQAGLFATGIPILALPYLEELRNQWEKHRSWLRGAAIGGAVGICTLQYTGALEMGNGLPVTGVNAKMLPCIPTEFLEQMPVPQKLFNSYSMGGYLLYHLGSRLPVFIDGRLDVYDPKVWADYLAAEENRLSVETLRQRYGVNTFAIETRDAFGDPVHLANRLTNSPEWALVFFDDDYAIFVHRAEAASDVLAGEFRLANPFAPQRFLAAVRNAEQRERALREIGSAIKISNGAAAAYALAALAADALGETNTALEYREQAVMRDPNCPLLQWKP